MYGKSQPGNRFSGNIRPGRKAGVAVESGQRPQRQL